jgi:hypothetical protein
MKSELAVKYANSKPIKSIRNTGGASWIGFVFFMFIFSMFVAAILDTSTALPAIVWGSAWAGGTLLGVLLPMPGALHPINKVDRESREILTRYYALPKDKRALFPKAAIEQLMDVDNPVDYEVSRSVSKLLREVEDNMALLARRDNSTILEELERSRTHLKIETDTHREYR